MLNGFRCDQRMLAWQKKTDCSSLLLHIFTWEPRSQWYHCLVLPLPFVKPLAADHSGVTILLVNGNYLGGTPSSINQVLFVSFG